MDEAGEKYKETQKRHGQKVSLRGEEYIEYKTRPFTGFDFKKGGIDFSINKIMHFCLLLQMLPIRKEDKVLDIGVGGGWTSEWLARWGHDVTATDLVEEYIGIARERANELDLPNLKTVQADAEDLPFEDESFDVVLVYDALHHCPDYKKAISEIYRVLKGGGWFAASEPSAAHIRDCSEYQKETGIFEGGFNHFGLKKELKKLGFGRVHVRLNPIFYKSYVPHRVLKKVGLSFTGLAQDFIMRFLSPLVFILRMNREGFKISAQKR
jgi:ubiquinone/menaquinone biosynthesis C-methylase UbiE